MSQVGLCSFINNKGDSVCIINLISRRKSAVYLYVYKVSLYLQSVLEWYRRDHKIINKPNGYIICFVKHYVGVLGSFWNIDKEAQKPLASEDEIDALKSGLEEEGGGGLAGCQFHEGCHKESNFNMKLFQLCTHISFFINSFLWSFF